MKQSRIDSVMESLVNIVIGLTINFTANMLIFPLFGWYITASQNILIGVIYTVISFVRSYLIRRAFNGKSVWSVIKRLLL